METAKPKVVKAPKEKFSWTKEILKVEVNGEPLRVEAADAKTIYERLSREVKIKCPKGVFKTDAVSEPGYLLVTRTA